MYLKITYLKLILLFIIVLLFFHSYSILPYHTQKFNNIFNSKKNKFIIENYDEGHGSHVLHTFKWFFLFGRDIIFNVVPNYTWITRYYDKKNDWVRANKGLPPLLPTPLPAGSKVNVNINREDSDFKLGSSGRSLMNMML